MKKLHSWLIYLCKWHCKTRGLWWPWSRSPELSGSWGIEYNSRDFNHNPLVTSIGSSMIWPNDLIFDPIWPFSKMYKLSSRQKLWTSFICIRPKIWSLEHTQGFSKVWPSDLVFDPTWPIFNLVRNFIKTNILTKFHDNWTENAASRVYTRFFKRFDLVFYPKWPIFKHHQDFINKTFWPSFIIIGLKMWPLEHTQDFSRTWTCDLVFDPTWTIF